MYLNYDPGLAMAGLEESVMAVFRYGRSEADIPDPETLGQEEPSAASTVLLFERLLLICKTAIAEEQLNTSTSVI